MYYVVTAIKDLVLPEQQLQQCQLLIELGCMSESNKENYPCSSISMISLSFYSLLGIFSCHLHLQAGTFKFYYSILIDPKEMRPNGA